MPGGKAEVVVAGHICLDLIPELSAPGGKGQALFTPGRLFKVGPAVLSTGGAVSNTGIALHRLGVPVRLMGKVGEDLLGRALLSLLREQGASLAEGMLVAPGEHTSYTVVLSAPGMDRLFLHCPGANDTFRACDVTGTKLSGARLLHFGYPPLMRRIFLERGRELGELFRRAKRRGLTTSLDMAMPDLASEAGRVDWRAWLARVLPHTDIFLPSLEEMLLMWGRCCGELGPRGAGGAPAGGRLLSEISARLLHLGAAVVGLKLGNQGLYLRTTEDAARLRALGAGAPRAPRLWAGRELLAPCFKVTVAGTTGSGDCTIAGFLAGLLRALPPEEAVTVAMAVGACCVEEADATSGVPGWGRVEARIRRGWKRLPVALKLPGWQWDAARSLYRGPNDARP